MSAPRAASRLASVAASRAGAAWPAAGRTCTTSRSTRPLRASAFFADGVERAAARRGHGRARHAADRRGVLHRQERRHARSTSCRSRSTHDGARPRPGALQHLLHAVPRPDRRRQRHGRAARLSAAAVVPHRSAAQRRGRLLLRRDDQRLRPMPDYARRSRRAIAGRSSPTSARCSSASTRPTADVPGRRPGGGRQAGGGGRGQAGRAPVNELRNDMATQRSDSATLPALATPAAAGADRRRRRPAWRAPSARSMNLDQFFRS